MAGSHVRLIEKIGVAVVDVPRFVWAMRPAWMSLRPDYPWVYYSNINRPVKWGKSERGVLCGWSGATDLWVSTVFPGLGYRMLKRAFLHWPIRFSAAVVKRAEPIDVSFVIGHRGRERLPLLLATLQSIAAQADACIECLVVEQSVQPEIQESLPDWIRYIHTPLPHPEMPYCRSWALNVGARAARGSVLVLHDGDVSVPMHYAREVSRIAKEGYQVIHLLRFRFDLDIKTSSAVMASHRLPANGRTEMIFQNFSAGTSIAVEREAYFSLGGFDEEFVGWGPEDEEFFQRCRQAKTYAHMYLPFLHFYHPMQPTRGSQSQTRNRELFEARSAIPPDQRIRELRDRGFGNVERPEPWYPPISATKATKKHLLLVTYGLPHPPEKGKRSYDFAMLKQIAQEYSVFLLSVLEFPREVEYLSDIKPYCTLVHTVGAKPHSLWEQLYGVFDGFLSRRPVATHPFFYYELFLTLRDIVRHWPIDIVQIGPCFLAPYIEAVSADNRCKKVLLLNDFDVTPYDRSTPTPFGFKTPLIELKQAIRHRWETRYARKFDQVLVRSPMQRQRLLARNPDLPIAVIEDAVDSKHFRPLSEATEPHTLLFVCCMEDVHCMDAALRFCGEILTHIECDVPDVQLLVAGNSALTRAQNPARPNNLVIIGAVPDLISYYQKAQISIMPLGSGSRNRGEILKAMALGRPIISTLLGCEGLSVKHGENILIADTPAGFAECILRLFRNKGLRLEISGNARNLVETQYDSAVIGQKLMNLYSSNLGIARRQPFYT